VNLEGKVNAQRAEVSVTILNYFPVLTDLADINYKDQFDVATI
jgi:hypothetical protein